MEAIHFLVNHRGTIQGFIERNPTVTACFYLYFMDSRGWSRIFRKSNSREKF